MWTIIATFLKGMGTMFSGSGALGTILDGVKSIWGNKNDRDRWQYQLDSKVQDSYAAEMMAPEKKHWFNMIVDGANRLVRPLFTYGIIIMFWWAAIRPVEFVAFVKTIQIVPEAMWYIMWTIIGFWFGGRILENRNMPSTRIDPQILGDMLRDRDETNYLNRANAPIVQPVGGVSQISSINANKTVTNSAIAEWNKRRQQQ